MQDTNIGDCNCSYCQVKIEDMSFKSTIKKSFFGNYLISISHCVRSKIEPALISDEKAVKRYYKKKSGKQLNLDNPQTFSEKLNWYKLYDRNPLMAKCADKVTVRDFINEKGYGDCLNKIYGVYDRVQDIDLSKLPNQFVIKAAHGSHMNYIVKDKSTFNWKQAKKMMRTWLHQDIYWSGREWVYKDLPKRIIVEKYLEDKTGELSDYKFFCFNGIPCYLQVDVGRFKDHYRSYYAMDKCQIDINDNDSFPRLSNHFPIQDEIFDRMKQICKDLAKPFQEVRVDFYLVNDKIFFGELTFFDGGGSTVFSPEEWNVKFSESWIIKK